MFMFIKRFAESRKYPFLVVEESHVNIESILKVVFKRSMRMSIKPPVFIVIVIGFFPDGTKLHW